MVYYIGLVVSLLPFTIYCQGRSIDNNIRALLCYNIIHPHLGGGPEFPESITVLEGQPSVQFPCKAHPHRISWRVNETEYTSLVGEIRENLEILHDGRLQRLIIPAIRKYNDTRVQCTVYTQQGVQIRNRTAYLTVVGMYTILSLINNRIQNLIRTCRYFSTSWMPNSYPHSAASGHRFWMPSLWRRLQAWWGWLTYNNT